MKVKVMAHRMRTQRSGIESADREVFIRECEYAEAVSFIAEAEKVRNEIGKAGYPWEEREVMGYNPNIYDEYYIRIDP
jgi:hypothetical protein